MNRIIGLAAVVLFSHLNQFDLFVVKAAQAGGSPVALTLSSQERLIEDVEIRGNRRITREVIMRSIKSKPGEQYREEQGPKDLEALRALGFFDPQQTRLTIDRGPRGGVILIFEVKEYPLIRDIQFQGLKAVSEGEILNRFKEQNIDLKRETLLIREKVEAATKIISELLKSKGLSDAKVTAEVEDISPITVILVFRIAQ